MDRVDSRLRNYRTIYTKALVVVLLERREWSIVENRLRDAWLADPGKQEYVCCYVVLFAYGILDRHGLLADFLCRSLAPRVQSLLVTLLCHVANLWW